MKDKGTLYIVATPIGNLEDITLRGLSVLRDSADLILCEDTRYTAKLLNHYNIKKTTRPLHSHTSAGVIGKILERISLGENAAYVTDSGTPGISDPGSRLVSMARDVDIPVVPLPGPSALTSLVSISGFPSKRIAFGGFTTKKPGKRIRELEELKALKGIVVVYESPHRIEKMLRAVAEVFPGKNVVIAREMTKIHEEIISGTIEEIISRLESLTQKGEFAIAIDNS